LGIRDLGESPSDTHPEVLRTGGRQMRIRNLLISAVIGAFMVTACGQGTPDNDVETDPVTTTVVVGTTPTTGLGTTTTNGLGTTTTTGLGTTTTN
jgi:hypothetical protein